MKPHICVCSVCKQTGQSEAMHMFVIEATEVCWVCTDDLITDWLIRSAEHEITCVASCIPPSYSGNVNV